MSRTIIPTVPFGQHEADSGVVSNSTGQEASGHLYVCNFCSLPSNDLDVLRSHIRAKHRELLRPSARIVKPEPVTQALGIVKMPTEFISPTLASLKAGESGWTTLNAILVDEDNFVLVDTAAPLSRSSTRRSMVEVERHPHSFKVSIAAYARPKFHPRIIEAGADGLVPVTELVVRN